MSHVVADFYWEPNIRTIFVYLFSEYTLFCSLQTDVKSNETKEKQAQTNLCAAVRGCNAQCSPLNSNMFFFSTDFCTLSVVRIISVTLHWTFLEFCCFFVQSFKPSRTHHKNFLLCVFSKRDAPPPHGLSVCVVAWRRCHKRRDLHTCCNIWSDIWTHETTPPEEEGAVLLCGGGRILATVVTLTSEGCRVAVGSETKLQVQFQTKTQTPLCFSPALLLAARSDSTCYSVMSSVQLSVEVPPPFPPNMISGQLGQL